MSRARIQAGDGDPRHGTSNGYNNLRCRCEPCRDAWNTYFVDYLYRTGRRRPWPEYVASLPRTHGAARYNAGCRCDDCRRATRERKQRYRLAKRAS